MADLPPSDEVAAVGDELRKRLPVERESSPWSDVVGPCRDTASTARLLGWSENLLAAAADRGQLLRAVTEDGVAVYPDFQFVGGHVVAGLPEVLAALGAAVDDPWQWAGWLNANVPGRGRHIDALRAGRVAEVFAAANRDAASWAS